MSKAQDDAVNACITIIAGLGDGDCCYETLANLCYNWFIRTGWEDEWPSFAPRVAHAMAQRHLLDEPIGHA